MPLLWLEHPVSLVTPQVPGAASQKTSSNRRARLTSQQDWPGRAQTGLVQTVVSVRAVCSAKRTARTQPIGPFLFFIIIFATTMFSFIESLFLVRLPIDLLLPFFPILLRQINIQLVMHIQNAPNSETSQDKRKQSTNTVLSLPR